MCNEIKSKTCFPNTAPADRQKAIASCLTLFYGWLEVAPHGATYTIPPKKNTKEPWDIDWWLYKEHHLVECFSNKLNNFRHISARYDKLATSYLTFIYIVAIYLLTK